MGSPEPNLADSEVSASNVAREIARRDTVLVLFYVSWCPFCQEFMPIFDEYAKANGYECMKIDVDHEPELSNQFLVDYYPALILFRKGRMVKRLDSEPNVGLTRCQFQEFIGT